MADVQKPLTIAAHAAIVLGIAYTVAQATWFFVVGPDVAPVRASTASPASSAPDPVPIERLVAQHIFGKPAAPGELPRREVTETLRETRLALELVGVFVADDAAASSAVIARKGRPAELYAVGDGLPGNAKLAEVFADRVVIARGGTRELLRFEKPQVVFASSMPATAPAPSDPVPAEAVADPSAGSAASEARGVRHSMRQVLAENRDRFENDPRRALEELGVAVADNGAPGYELGALGDWPELGHTGLRQGDRILSVNGQAVGNAPADRLDLDALLALGSASLEVQRGERRFQVTVALD